MTTYVVEYSSNNSGGHWWLSDTDWENLEKAGWIVEWIRNSNNLFARGDRFLGALATSASLVLECGEDEDPINSFRIVLESFEKLLGQSVTDQGCNCCGSPHYFILYKVNGEDRERIVGAGGEDLLQYMYERVPNSLREAAELLKKGRILMPKFRKKPVIIEAIRISKKMTVETLEGVMTGNPGDWLITGVNGEQYFCKDDIFHKTYEPVEKDLMAFMMFHKDELDKNLPGE